MKLRIAALLWMWLCVPIATAQEFSDYRSVELRVNSKRPNATVVVDRGARDGMRKGFLVLFFPRAQGQGGRSYEGTILSVAERTAVVRLIDPKAPVVPGTRGEVLVPVDADPLQAPSEPEPWTGVPQTDPEPPTVEQDEQEPLEHPAWENTDDDWTPGLPLLAGVDAVRPETRPKRHTGRIYFIADHIQTFDGDRSDDFMRLGEDFLFENPFGLGGDLHVDSELNYRRTDVPDNDNEEKTRLRVDRLSYTLGGTRFAHEGYEMGRFLQGGMPEFGFLDGFEYGQRLRDGHRIGGSIGFMPEPDERMESSKDFQISGYYRWVADASERVSFDAGYQKTWHNSAPDRDLLVAKFRYLPINGWRFLSTAWIDFYTSGDDAKGSGLELTQAHATFGHVWENGNTLNFVYQRILFPEIDRHEFSSVAVTQLADDHNDRLSVNGTTWVTERQRFHGEAGAWTDEDEEGGDIEVGIDVMDVFVEDSLIDFTLFGTKGRFSSVAGARVTFGKYTDRGRWDVMYEILTNDQEGFPDEFDDLRQHRVRGSRDFLFESGWNLSTYAEGVFWEDEDSFALGVYMQRSF